MSPFAISPQSPPLPVHAHFTQLQGLIPQQMWSPHTPPQPTSDHFMEHGSAPQQIQMQERNKESYPQVHDNYNATADRNLAMSPLPLPQPVGTPSTTIQNISPLPCEIEVPVAFGESNSRALEDQASRQAAGEPFINQEDMDGRADRELKRLEFTK